MSLRYILEKYNVCVCLGGWAGSCTSTTLTLKKGARTSDYQSNEPFFKFYMTTLSTTTLYAPRVFLQPLP